MAATTIYPIPPFTPEGEYYKGIPLRSPARMTLRGVWRSDGNSLKVGAAVLSGESGYSTWQSRR
jgi:hypothetical protein